MITLVCFIALILIIIGIVYYKFFKVKENVMAEERKIIEERMFNSCDEFLQALGKGEDIFANLKYQFIYRGLSRDTYELIPTAFRYSVKQLLDLCQVRTNNEKDTKINQIVAESLILMNFYTNCDLSKLYIPDNKRLRRNARWVCDYSAINIKEKWMPEDFYEIAALAQHYGLPTRLLDWTYDIKIAIYFAISAYLDRDESNRPKEGNNIVIWILDSTITKAGLIDDITSYLNEINSKNGVNSINKLKFIRPRYLGNPNLTAQKGILTLWEEDVSYNGVDEKRVVKSLDVLIKEYAKDNENFMSMLPKPFMYKIVIKADDWYLLYQWLKMHRCDASYLFPGYRGAADTIFQDSIVREIMKSKKIKLCSDCGIIIKSSEISKGIQPKKSKTPNGIKPINSKTSNGIQQKDSEISQGIQQKNIDGNKSKNKVKIKRRRRK